ncbi:hypothetical protein IWW36_004342, partial [Coemansia brasiliensis]
MDSKNLVVLGASMLALVAATIEQAQHPGAFAGNQVVVDGAGGIYIPANIVEVGYAPQTLVAAQEYASNKDKYAEEHRASNAQGARAAESISSPLFRTMTLSESFSDGESSGSSEDEQDSSGLDTSAGSSMLGSIGGAAALLLSLGSLASLY